MSPSLLGSVSVLFCFVLTSTGWLWAGKDMHSPFFFHYLRVVATTLQNQQRGNLAGGEKMAFGRQRPDGDQDRSLGRTICILPAFSRDDLWF